MKAKDLSLKISWVRYLQIDENMANLAYSMIEPNLGEDIWAANIKSSDIDQISTKNKFWKDVIKAWSVINFVEKIQTPGSQFIWFNSHIRCADKIFIFKKAYASGLKWVHQLFHENGSFKSDREPQYGFNLHYTAN